MPWILCVDCFDYYCTIHEMHAAECPCPPVDAWARCGLDPYDEMSRADAMSVIVSSQGWDEVVH